MFFLSIGILFARKPLLLLFYVVGYLANELLNRVLKPILRDPRPVPLSSTDKYGMPSGHSQLAAYSLVFLALVTAREKYNGWILLLFSLLTLATMVQRVLVKAHTVEQCIIGALLGGILGYVCYGLFNQVNNKIGKKNIAL